MREILAAAQPIYGTPKNLCVWTKTNAGMGTFYRSQHELVFVFKVGTGHAHQQFWSRRERPLPVQRLDLPRRKHLQARPDGGVGAPIPPSSL